MELKNIYQEFNGNYESVLGRLRTDERIIKYLKKFEEGDINTLITKALDEEDYETAFRESHNLKGICANLNMDALGASASELTEALRGGKPEGNISALVSAMLADYEMTVNAIKKI